LHNCKTTACSFTPNNVFIATGDEQGNLKIVFVDDLKIKKEFNHCLGGKINGISWNEENDKLLVYGEGKSV
jgi:hypothetical protein